MMDATEVASVPLLDAVDPSKLLDALPLLNSLYAALTGDAVMSSLSIDVVVGVIL